MGVKIFVPRASEQRERRRGGAGGAGAPLGQLPPPHRVVEQPAQLPRPEDRDHAEVRQEEFSVFYLLLRSSYYFHDVRRIVSTKNCWRVKVCHKVCLVPIEIVLKF